MLFPHESWFHSCIVYNWYVHIGYYIYIICITIHPWILSIKYVDPHKFNPSKNLEVMCFRVSKRWSCFEVVSPLLRSDGIKSPKIRRVLRRKSAFLSRWKTGTTGTGFCYFLFTALFLSLGGELVCFVWCFSLQLWSENKQTGLLDTKMICFLLFIFKERLTEKK